MSIGLTVCQFPGCVVSVNVEGMCIVHASGDGKRCEACNGSGWLWREDAADSKRAKQSACDRCGGIGLKDAKASHRIPKSEREAIDTRPLIQIANE